MKLISPSFKVMRGLDRDVIPFLEECGRTCYKSEDHITETSASKFVAGIVKSGHESVIEHAVITVRIVGSRSMTHQLVRHRLAAYSQESQRFVNYSKGKFSGEITFIDPNFRLGAVRYDLDDYGDVLEKTNLTAEEDAVYKAYTKYVESFTDAEEYYMELIGMGVPAEDAREVLPNSCKTEIVMTANLRVWRHIFEERAINKHAQFQIRQIMLGILDEFSSVLPEVFGDLKEKANA